MTLPLRLRLEQLTNLSSNDRQALAAAMSHTVAIGANEDLIRQDESPNQCYLVIEGMLCRYKRLRAEKRQIVGFHIAGDFCDLNGPIMGRMDHSVASLTPAKLAVFPRTSLLRLIEQRQKIGLALWKETIADAAIAREWVANVGSRQGYERIAHLLCEMGRRFEAAGLAQDGNFEWPVTQTEVADAMGLSVVHVNRIFQQLRSEGLVSGESKGLTILDWTRLEKAGDFTPAYLFLVPVTQSQRPPSS